MDITTSYPPINLSERGVQIDLSKVEQEGMSDNHLAQQAPPRSKGIHCSSLIKSIAMRCGWIKPRGSAKDNHGSRFNLGEVIDDEDFPLVMAIGMAWEDWLSRQYPEMMYHIGELHKDGISMSPDGVTIPHDDEFDFDEFGSGIIEEFKFTYKSSRKRIEDQLLWLTQVKAYCWAFGTRAARLHVVYANGDYDYARQGMPPQYIVYSLVFSWQELESNWNMLLNELADWKLQGLIDDDGNLTGNH